MAEEKDALYFEFGHPRAHAVILLSRMSGLSMRSVSFFESALIFVDNS